MKLKSTLPHLLWAGVTSGAYLLGGHGDRSSSSSDVMLATPGSSSSLLGERNDPNQHQKPAGQDSKTSLNAETAPLNETDIIAMAKEAFKDSNPLKRSLAFAKLLESMTPENASMIEAQLREFGAEGNDWTMFRYAWGSIDGEAALAAAMNIENERYKQAAQSSAISGWASANPSEAIGWMDQLEDGKDKDRLQEALVSGLADNNITTATDYVYRLADAGNKRAGDYLETVASEQLRNKGAESAASWADQLPDSGIKAAAMDRIANAYVNMDPAAAAAWAGRYADTDYAARVIEEVGDEWAERKPAEAIDWLETLQDGQGKEQGMRSALGEWVRRDPTAASEYLAQMPDSAVKDAAISGFVDRLAWEDPTSAIAWASTIGQDGRRQEALVDAARAWYRRDREAAASWLETSGLSSEAQQKVVESRRRERG